MACEIILSSPGTGNRGTLYFLFSHFPFSHSPFPIPYSPIPVPNPSTQSQAQSQSLDNCKGWQHLVGAYRPHGGDGRAEAADGGPQVVRVDVAHTHVVRAVMLTSGLWPRVEVNKESLQILFWSIRIHFVSFYINLPWSSSWESAPQSRGRSRRHYCTPARTVAAGCVGTWPLSATGKMLENIVEII